MAASRFRLLGQNSKAVGSGGRALPAYPRRAYSLGNLGGLLRRWSLALSGSWDGTVKVWALDWELETFNEADWDEGARPYLVNFLTLHTPFVGQLPQDREPTEEEVKLALTRRGKPTWTEEEFQGLIRQLQYAGLRLAAPRRRPHPTQTQWPESGKNRRQILDFRF